MLHASEGGLDAVFPASISQWTTDAFRKLPCYDHARDNDYDVLDTSATVFSTDGTTKGFRAFRRNIDRYLETVKAELVVADRWPLDEDDRVLKRIEEVYDPTSGDATLPYVMKVVVPAGSKVALFGDLHGSVHSFLRTLRFLQQEGYLSDDFTVAPAHRRSFFMVFMGDYVDRGANGVEVLSLVLLLRQRNPGNVFAARGNHEDAPMNENSGPDGFTQELIRKFPRAFGGGDAARRATLEEVYRLYETLPAAIFLGVNKQNATSTEKIHHLLCVHGGIEFGFDPRVFLSQISATPHAHSGAVLEFALLRGLRRLDYISAPENAPVKQAISAQVTRQLHNYGSYYAVKYVATPCGCGKQHGAPAAAGTAEQMQDDGDVDMAVDSSGAQTSVDAVANKEAPSAETEDADVLASVLSSSVDAGEAEPAAEACPLPTLVPKLPAHKHGLYPAHDRKAYPYDGQPLGTDPGLGYMWYDFFVHHHPTNKHRHWIDHNPRRGLAMGFEFTRHWLSVSTDNSVVAIMRAHQHNDASFTGPMLSEMVRGEGVADNWGGSNLVLTFVSGGFIPYLNNPYDSFGLFVATDRAPETWRVQRCRQRPGQRFIRTHDGQGRGQWSKNDRNGWSLPSLKRRPDLDEESLSRVQSTWAVLGGTEPTVSHACDADIVNFRCDDLPWRASSTASTFVPKPPA